MLIESERALTRCDWQTEANNYYTLVAMQICSWHFSLSNHSKLNLALCDQCFPDKFKVHNFYLTYLFLWCNCFALDLQFRVIDDITLLILLNFHIFILKQPTIRYWHKIIYFILLSIIIIIYKKTMCWIQLCCIVVPNHLHFKATPIVIYNYYKTEDSPCILCKNMKPKLLDTIVINYNYW